MQDTLETFNPAAVSARKVLDGYLKGKPKKVITRISPSQLGGCHRAHYYKIMGVLETMEPSIGQLSNFETGFVWERIFEAALVDQKVPFESQIKMVDIELNMEGTLDFMIGDYKNKDALPAIIIDTKTQRSEWFWYRQSKKKRRMFDSWEEDYRYLIQQGCYLIMAERLNWNVKMARLAYISKDDGFIGEELDVPLTGKLRKEIMGRIKEMNHYLSHDILPPCTCEGWMVGYCDYGDPNTMEPNRKKKMVTTRCCGTPEELDEWRAKQAEKKSFKTEEND